jgi:hypothetical protein
VVPPRDRREREREAGDEQARRAERCAIASLQPEHQRPNDDMREDGRSGGEPARVTLMPIRAAADRQEDERRRRQEDREPVFSISARCTDLGLEQPERGREPTRTPSMVPGA